MITPTRGDFYCCEICGMELVISQPCGSKNPDAIPPSILDKPPLFQCCGKDMALEEGQ